MKVRIKKFLGLLLVWISFGFALNQYLGQDLLPVDVEQDLSGDAALSDDEIGSDGSNVIVEPLTQDDFISEVKRPALRINEVQLVPGKSDLEFGTSWPELLNLLKYNFMNKPDLKLTIVGYFDATEPIAEPNLGLQRSVQIKNKLTQAGLSGDRINCTSEIQRLFQGADDRTGIVLLSTEKLDNPQFNTPDSTPPLQNSVTTAQNEPEQLASEKKADPGKTQPRLRQRAKPNPVKYRSLVLQPTLEDQGVVVDGDLKGLLPQVEEWFNLNPSHYVTIIGHTDNVGHEQDNYRLALKWARQVGAYFRANGLSANRLEIKSLGEEQPLFTNKTMRGRQKNRRVELIFKY